MPDEESPNAKLEYDFMYEICATSAIYTKVLDTETIAIYEITADYCGPRIADATFVGGIPYYTIFNRKGKSSMVTLSGMMDYVKKRLKEHREFLRKYCK